MSKLWTTAIYVLAVLPGSFLCVPCLASDDFQFWSTNGATFGLSKNWTGTLEEETRFTRDAGHLTYYHLDMGFVYKGIANWIDLSFNYRQAYEQPGNNQWREEHRPHINTTLRTSVLGLALSDRSRLEYRDREIKDDTWRYRNRLTVNMPLELTPLKLQPYLADEVFLNLDGEALEENRCYAGFAANLLKNLKGDIYYARRLIDSAGRWTDADVVGIQLRIAFEPIHAPRTANHLVTSSSSPIR